ncbi:hypothetical protein [uncultured Veillonella sp.]|uniref:hypothetical protein n=1 Tax=uncultured Veillonella sp. TaxID=159268 RepID=UPI0025FDC4BD|nr:hypothetical protein [uncultured Veillonella sp.]MDY3974084.1 hypothetical protein [Veillonella caviae]
MKRLTLQDMRSLIKKKGRLLYGAVFLFCLVLIYGLYMKWQSPSNEAAKAGQMQVGNDSKSATSVYNAQPSASMDNSNNSASMHNSKPSASKYSSQSEGAKGKQIMSLYASLRGLPFKNPFYRDLQSKVVDLDGLGNLVDESRGSLYSKLNHSSPKGRRQLDYDRNSLNNRSNNRPNRRSNTYMPGNNKGALGDELNGDSIEPSSLMNNYGTSRHDVLSSGALRGETSQTLNSRSISLVGIIQGVELVAILHSAQGEGVYAVGEGPAGVTIQYIGESFVDIMIDGASQRLYLP